MGGREIGEGVWAEGWGKNGGIHTLQVIADLVLELFTVNAAPAAAGPRRVAALDHKVLDDAVEDGVVVVAALCEGGEVLARLGRVLVVQLHEDRALPVC